METTPEIKLELKLGKTYVDSTGTKWKVVYCYEVLKQPYKYECLSDSGYAYFSTNGTHRNNLYNLVKEIE
jgi:hypothetical protein